MTTHDPSHSSSLEAPETTLYMDMPENSNPFRSYSNDSTSTVGLPELTSDGTSPPNSAGPITPSAEDGFQAAQDQVQGGSPNNKLITQRPIPNLSEDPAPNRAQGHDISAKAVRVPPVQFGEPRTPQSPSQAPSPTEISPSLRHAQKAERDFSTSPEAHTQLQRIQNGVQPVRQAAANAPTGPEGAALTTPPAVDPTTHQVESESQQSYWTVDPFQNQIANERSQERTPNPTCIPSLVESVRAPLNAVSFFCLDTLPRQIYLHLLLRLPSLYFSRITRIFRDAELSLPEMQRLALATWVQYHGIHNVPAFSGSELNPTHSEAFANLKFNWEAFIERLMTEWKMNNIVSVLLLSAILTTLQIDGVSNDPVARNAALAALVCGLMGLLYGCLYIVRFGTMSKAYKAIQWAEEAQQTKTRIFWNVWVLLAMPAVWLAWSIILFMTSIMAYLWRTGSTHDPVLRLSPTMALGPRLAVTGLFALGMLYLGLIIFTLRHYGDAMDENWKKRVASWVRENIPREAFSRSARSGIPPPFPMMPPGFGQMPLPSTPVSFAVTSHHSPWHGNGQPPPIYDPDFGLGSSIPYNIALPFSRPGTPALYDQSFPTAMQFPTPGPLATWNQLLPSTWNSMPSFPVSHDQTPTTEWYDTNFSANFAPLDFAPQAPLAGAPVSLPSPHTGNQYFPTEWHSPGFNPAFSDLSRLPLEPIPLPIVDTPTQSDGQQPGVSLPNSPGMTPSSSPLVELPVDEPQPEPSPNTSISSLPTLDAYAAVGMPTVLHRNTKLPLGMLMSGLRDPYNFSDFFKAVFPATFKNPNPYGLNVQSFPVNATLGMNFLPARLVSLNVHTSTAWSIPPDLDVYEIVKEDWQAFITGLGSVWNNIPPAQQPKIYSEYFSLEWFPRRQDLIACLLHWWNILLFLDRGLQAMLCEEFTSDSSWDTEFVIYLIQYEGPWNPPALREMFEPLGQTTKLKMIGIYPPFNPSTPDVLLPAKFVLLDVPLVPRQSRTWSFHAVRLAPLVSAVDEVDPGRLLKPSGGSVIDSMDRDILARFITTMHRNWATIENIWGDTFFLTPLGEQLLAAWNESYFWRLNMEAVLCKEVSAIGSEIPYVYAIYISDRTKFPEIKRFVAPPDALWLEYYGTNDHGFPCWIIVKPHRVHFQVDAP